MSKKLTNWFSGRTKPARAGVYERKIHAPTSCCRTWRFAFWDGSRWSPARDTPQKAEAAGMHASGIKQAPWRGLAAKP